MVTRDRIFGRRRKAAQALLLASVTALAPSTVEAHGGNPRAFSIFIEPGNPDDIVLRSDVWGLFRSTDGGKNWVNGCAELYRSRSTNADHVGMTVLPGGRIVVAAGFEGLHVSDDFCSWHKAEGFSRDLPDGGIFQELVVDVQRRGSDLIALTSTYMKGEVVTRPWTSSDNGETWALTGDRLSSNFSGSSLGIPPAGAPHRVYVTGSYAGTDYVAARSDDDGATWSESKVPSHLAGARLRVGLIHPVDPDIFILWADKSEDIGVDSPDELYGTKDGGKTFVLLYASKGDLPGFALSPDNTELLIAGPLEGIMAAKLDDALANGQKAFQQRSVCDPQPCSFWGLHWTGDGLYAGTDDYKGARPLSTFGVSHDGGRTFSKLMGVCDVKLATSCGAMSTMSTTCAPIWETGFARDYTNTDRCTPGSGGTAGSDSGTPGVAGGGSGKAGVAGSGGAGGSGADPAAGGASSRPPPVDGAGGGTGGSSPDAGQRGSVRTVARNPGGGGCDCSLSPSVGRPAEGALALVLLALGTRRRRRGAMAYPASRFGTAQAAPAEFPRCASQPGKSV